MVEYNIIPDTFLIIQDSSDDFSILMKRWYNENRQTIDERISNRLAEEEARRLEEAKRYFKIIQNILNFKIIYF